MRWQSGTTKWRKKALGFYPDAIHCSNCGNYKFSGLQSIDPIDGCCMIVDEVEIINHQSKLILFSKLF